MAWRAYNTVNGQILGETSSSGARPLDYQLDALGSVVGTIKTNGTLENTYRYAGYGQQVSKTGLGTDQKFLWVGGWGYRAQAPLYQVVYRQLLNQSASWTSKDPLVLKDNVSRPFSYAHRNPATRYDCLGLCDVRTGAPAPCSTSQMASIKSCCDNFTNVLDWPWARKAIMDCIKRTHPGGIPLIDLILDRMYALCSGTGCLRILCPPYGPPPQGWPSNCTACNLDNAAVTVVGYIDRPPNPGGQGASNPFDDYPGLDCRLHPFNPNVPCEKLRGPDEDCVIAICPDEFSKPDLCSTLFHEMIHCTSGLTHANPSGNNGTDFVYALERCIAGLLGGSP